MAKNDENNLKWWFWRENVWFWIRNGDDQAKHGDCDVHDKERVFSNWGHMRDFDICSQSYVWNTVMCANQPRNNILAQSRNIVLAELRNAHSRSIVKYLFSPNRGILISSCQFCTDVPSRGSPLLLTPPLSADHHWACISFHQWAYLPPWGSPVPLFLDLSSEHHHAWILLRDLLRLFTLHHF